MIRLVLFSFLFGFLGNPSEAFNSSSSFRPGKDYAVFFATKDYSNDGWQNLRNPIRDAEAVAYELQTNFGYKTEIYRNPNKRKIYDSLKKYRNKVYDKDDQLFIFFSGHGHYEEETTEGFIIPSDGKSLSNDPYGESWIPHSRLRDIIASIPCEHIFVIIDACFSGTFDRKIVLNRNAAVDIHVEDGLRYNSRLYLASGGKQYVSDGQDHSPFTRQLLNTLRWNKNGILNFLQLAGSMEFVKPKPVAGEFEGNEPGGNFYFIGQEANIPVSNGRFSRPSANRGTTSLVTERGSFRDRDNNTYTFKTLNDGRRWMTKNLNIRLDGSTCHEDKESNCDNFGRLYTWEAAKKGCELLPGNWRLPTEEEWIKMTDQYGGAYDSESREGLTAYEALMEGGTSGFEVALAGWRGSDGKYRDVGTYAFFWGSSSSVSFCAHSGSRKWETPGRFYSKRKYLIGYEDHSSDEFSVRCIHE